LNLSFNREEVKLVFVVEPYEEPFNLLPESLRSVERISLRVVPNEKLLNVEIAHKEPAFLGERYAVTISLTPIKGYKVTSVLLSFVDSEDIIPMVIKRKRSIVPYDSDAVEDPNWKFLLYVDKPERGVERLLEYSYTLQEIKPEGETIKLFLKFRVEGVKQYKIKVNSVSRKIMPDNSLGPEFTMENDYSIEINVLCPFIIGYDWFNPFTSIDSFSSKGVLDLNVKSIVSIKISTKSLEKILIHAVYILIKNLPSVKVFGNTKEDHEVIIGLSEAFTKTLGVLPTSTFYNVELGVIEILWSRLDDIRREKNVCQIPMEEVTCREPSINVLIEAPAESNLMQEFGIQIKIINPTPVIIETQMNLVTNDNFLIQGEIQTNTILLPYQEDNFKYILFPTRCGRLKLPYPLLCIMASGKVSDIVVNRKCEQFIYIFP